MQYVIDISESEFREMERVRYGDYITYYLDYVNEDKIDDMEFEDYYRIKTGNEIFHRELLTVYLIRDKIYDMFEELERQQELRGWSEETFNDVFNREVDVLIDKVILTNYLPDVEGYEYVFDFDAFEDKLEDMAIEEAFEDVAKLPTDEDLKEAGLLEEQVEEKPEEKSQGLSVDL